MQKVLKLLIFKQKNYATNFNFLGGCNNIYHPHSFNPYAGGQSITKNKIHYKGTVHCVKVPSGMILVKRNQGICVTGNSGDPVDIICGESFEKADLIFQEYAYFSHPKFKGVVELLWDVFGGTINEQGYKVLDSHIGAIYGDSITLERAEQICERLKQKGFASTNIVFGVGSYSMGYATRDNQGGAVKSIYVEINEEGFEIFKDPITDDGTKKSAKGLLCVVEEDGKIKLKDQATKVEENSGLLTTIFENGKMIGECSLSEIRQRINDRL